MAVTVKVPASSANLGPGFDALGLALGLYLEVTAEVVYTTKIVASGRDFELCGRLKDNLIYTTYANVVERYDKPVQPLALTVHNEIPLGKGCGSSAAAIVAGVVLANEIGQLGLTEQQILNEISRLEGHPDNVCAAYLGGLVTSAMDSEGHVSAIKVRSSTNWKYLVAIPDSSLSTEKARGMLPVVYSKADAILNVQNTALIVAAFAEGRGEVLARAMQDKMHQPYRMQACPLLPALLPMQAEANVLGVALSGAGPSVLLVMNESAEKSQIENKIEHLAPKLSPELLWLEVADGTFINSK